MNIFPNGTSGMQSARCDPDPADGDGGRRRTSFYLLKDVRQVTWQKLNEAGETDLASSNKFLGQRVNADFSQKVKFNPSLHNSSILLRQVEEQDEGCYRCLFHTYPDGTFTGKTCLQLQELHEPLLQVSLPDPPAAHRVLQCQATGRPAPNVTLSVSQPDTLD